MAHTQTEGSNYVTDMWNPTLLETRAVELWGRRQDGCSEPPGKGYCDEDTLTKVKKNCKYEVKAQHLAQLRSE